MLPSVIEHIGQVMLVGLIVLGPLPILFLLGQHLDGLQTAERIIAHLTIWSVVQIALGQALGYLGILRWECLLAVYLIVWIAFIVTARARDLRLAPNLKLLWLNSNSLKQFLVFVLATFALGLTVLALTQPITDYDSLNYHLPVIAKWYSTHSLAMEKWGLANYYPYNWEMLCALFILPFNGDYAVALPNVLAWVLFGLGVWAITKRLKVSSSYAIVGMSSLLTLPLVIEQITTLHIDLAFAAYFLAAVTFILGYRQSKRPILVFLLAITLGMLVGIKSSGLIYAAVLAGFMIASNLVSILERLKSAALAYSIKFALVLIVLIGVVGGGWYIRDWVEAGNPLAPVQIEIAGHVIFPGTLTQSDVTHTTLGALFNFGNGQHLEVLGDAIRAEIGLPLLFFLIGLCGLLPWLIRSNYGTARSDRLLLSTLGIIALVLYWFTPYSGDNGSHNWQITPWIGQALRYGLPFWSIMAVLGAAGAQALLIPKPLILILGIVLSGYALYTVSPPLLVVGICACVILIVARFISILDRQFFQMRRYATKLIAFIVISVGIFGGSFLLRDERAAQERVAYGSIRDWIDTHVTDKDVIGYSLAPQKYLLAGTQLDKLTQYAPAISDIAKSEWLIMLHQQGITLFAIGPLNPAWNNRPEVSWLQDQTYFRKVLGSDSSEQMVIYELQRAP